MGWLDNTSSVRYGRGLTVDVLLHPNFDGFYESGYLFFLTVSQTYDDLNYNTLFAGLMVGGSYEPPVSDEPDQIEHYYCGCQDWYYRFQHQYEDVPPEICKHMYASLYYFFAGPPPPCCPPEQIS